MIRPPVGLGCGAAVAMVVLAIVAVGFFVVFLGGGTSSDVITLAPAATYAPGTVTYDGEHNIYVARLAKAGFVILGDMDRANRESTTRKCRVQPMSSDDKELVPLTQQYSARMSPEAQSTTFLFKEACNGAIYDITGVRLDADGPNLPRYSSTVDASGKLEVDLKSRRCTQWEGADNPFAPIECAVGS